MSGEGELVKKAKLGMAILDEAYSSEEEENMPQPLEIEEENAVFEEAINTTVQSIKVQEQREMTPTFTNIEEDLKMEDGFISKIEVIPDHEWDERMSHYNYSSKQRLLIKKSIAKKNEFF